MPASIKPVDRPPHPENNSIAMGVRAILFFRLQCNELPLLIGELQGVALRTDDT
jgi:hypothetical protein